jgi:hypothetical protein
MILKCRGIHTRAEGASNLLDGPSSRYVGAEEGGRARVVQGKGLERAKYLSNK